MNHNPSIIHIILLVVGVGRDTHWPWRNTLFDVREDRQRVDSRLLPFKRLFFSSISEHAVCFIANYLIAGL
jgi:hypothetical protein